MAQEVSRISGQHSLLLDNFQFHLRNHYIIQPHAAHGDPYAMKGDDTACFQGNCGT